jgi:hypothetical protein
LLYSKKGLSLTETNLGAPFVKERHPWVVLSHKVVVHTLHPIIGLLQVMIITLFGHFGRGAAQHQSAYLNVSGLSSVCEHGSGYFWIVFPLAWFKPILITGGYIPCIRLS